MIKKSIFGVFAAVALSGLLCACTPQQSELRLDSVKETAVIEGLVTYDIGAYKDASGNVITYGGKYEPASGVTVIARIAHSQYVSGSNTGNYTVEAQTNSEGRYQLSIPTGAKTITATVTVLPFRKLKGVVDNGNLTQKEALYSANSSQSSVSAKDIKVVNIQANGQ
ncbi:MAG: hypothetical protein J5835_02090 [Bacteroidales bacterium]|nr:hypothetical protein [Bacteroidales bacterium]